MAQPIPQRLAGFFRGPSLRVRVTLWTVLISVVIQLIVGGIFFFYMRQFFDDRYNTALSRRAQKIVDALLALDRPVEDADLHRLARDVMFYPIAEGCVIAVYDGEGRPLASTIRPPPDLRDARAFRLITDERQHVGRVFMPEVRLDSSKDSTIRLLMRRLAQSRNQNMILLVATTDSSFQQLLMIIAQLSLMALAVGVCGTGVSAWLVSGVVISPLRKLRRFADTFNPLKIREEAPQLDPAAAELAAFERDLGDARERLRQAFNAQDRLISNVSHELKTPIAVLLTEAQTIDQDALPEEGRQFVGSVREEMRKLGRLIESFLMLTKLRGGRTLPIRGLCHLNDVAMEAIAGCTAAAAERGVTLQPRLADDSVPPNVYGDAYLLRVLIDHLLRHSIRRSPQGGEIIIEVQVRQDRDCLVRVSDQGPPIPLAQLATLFDRFSEAGQARHERQDLGLAVAQGIAELHGGRVVASNLEPGGCAFLLELALAGSSPEPTLPPTAATSY